ncbi:hypothetical protein LTR05_008291 [Lithohypha guttulata]|uniref:Uncharacterized protein n=1 Tax=Lithohypha guttulata TaxID=1690604 RepID=A0AAN7STD4_9EURO|nr:hypothetical protein LTR05_008291 [Lithohypha guttulata]
MANATGKDNEAQSPIDSIRESSQEGPTANVSRDKVADELDAQREEEEQDLYASSSAQREFRTTDETQSLQTSTQSSRQRLTPGDVRRRQPRNNTDTQPFEALRNRPTRIPRARDNVPPRLDRNLRGSVPYIKKDTGLGNWQAKFHHTSYPHGYGPMGDFIFPSTVTDTQHRFATDIERIRKERFHLLQDNQLIVPARLTGVLAKIVENPYMTTEELLNVYLELTDSEPPITSLVDGGVMIPGMLVKDDDDVSPTQHEENTAQAIDHNNNLQQETEPKEVDVPTRKGERLVASFVKDIFRVFQLNTQLFVTIKMEDPQFPDYENEFNVTIPRFVLRTNHLARRVSKATTAAAKELLGWIGWILHKLNPLPYVKKLINALGGFYHELLRLAAGAFRGTGAIIRECQRLSIDKVLLPAQATAEAAGRGSKNAALQTWGGIRSLATRENFPWLFAWICINTMLWRFGAFDGCRYWDWTDWAICGAQEAILTTILEWVLGPGRFLGSMWHGIGFAANSIGSGLQWFAKFCVTSVKAAYSSFIIAVLASWNFLKNACWGTIHWIQQLWAWFTAPEGLYRRFFALLALGLGIYFRSEAAELIEETVRALNWKQCSLAALGITLVVAIVLDYLMDGPFIPWLGRALTKTWIAIEDAIFALQALTRRISSACGAVILDGCDYMEAALIYLYNAVKASMLYFCKSVRDALVCTYSTLRDYAIYSINRIHGWLIYFFNNIGGIVITILHTIQSVITWPFRQIAIVLPRAYHALKRDLTKLVDNLVRTLVSIRDAILRILRASRAKRSNKPDANAGTVATVRAPRRNFLSAVPWGWIKYPAYWLFLVSAVATGVWLALWYCGWCGSDLCLSTGQGRGMSGLLGRIEEVLEQVLGRYEHVRMMQHEEAMAKLEEMVRGLQPAEPLAVKWKLW